MRNVSMRGLVKHGAVMWAMLLLPVAFGQQPEAPKVDTYYLLNSGGILTEMPWVLAELTGKGKLGGLAGVKESAAIPATKASTRLRPGDTQIFIVGKRGPLPESLPPAFYARLEKLDVDAKNGTRVLVYTDITSYGGFGVKSRSPGAGPGIALTFTRYDSNAIKIEPQAPLPPGEYAFSVPSGDPYHPLQYRLYCFGID